MNVFGSTRSTVRTNHALIAPDSFVRSPLPGWTQTQGVILISPQLGARFSQYLALMDAGAESGPSLPGIERMVYVLEGEVTVLAAKLPVVKLLSGGYAFVPADSDVTLRARTTSQVNVFEKRYLPLTGVVLPQLVAGQEQDVQGVPFLGDPDAQLQTLLPAESAFDLAVNIFTYRPGATLPMVEVHVMEHGLLMLQGQGIYRLGKAWYPVRQGDVIWMAPYCPQWFVAMGKGPARYLYYKDVNRDPLQGLS
jgi:(S)-ureidoglycine aminohydrolase